MSLMDEHPSLAYTDIVQREARKLIRKVPANVDIDDLIQVGMIALMEAYGRWDKDAEASIETWLTIRVKGALIDELRRQDHLPRPVRDKVKAVERARRTVEQRELREPRSSEVAAELGIGLSEYHRRAAIYSEIVSLEDLIADIGLREGASSPIVLWRGREFG